MTSWTDEENAIIEAMVRNGDTYLKTIAALPNRTRAAIQDKRNQLIRKLKRERSQAVPGTSWDSVPDAVIVNNRNGGCRFMLGSVPCGAAAEGKYCTDHVTAGFDRPDKHLSDHYTAAGNNFKRYG